MRDLPSFLAKLQGARLHGLAMVALFTGMRLGEVLALRWNRVDLDARSFRCAKHWSRREPTALALRRPSRGRAAGYHAAGYLGGCTARTSQGRA